MASIGLEGKHERRYFNGVQGQKGQEGELFGSYNLLRFISDDKILTDGIFFYFFLNFFRTYKKCETIGR